MELTGKKLLVLGANPIELFIIRRAKELGCYTIATDNHKDWVYAPAKFEAHEGWDISWSDIDALESKCRAENVDGVIAGFSEFRVENMIKLCKRLNKPCYITMDQLDVTRDKSKFKRLCAQYDMPTVPEFDPYQCDKIQYPVIVKPVDRAGSIGISVCYNKEEYNEGLNNALSLSPSRNVVVEKYFKTETKVDLYYLVINNCPIFIGSNDTLMCPPTKGLEIMQSAWLFPSKNEDVLLEKLDKNIKNMLKGLGIRNGYITISAFLDANKNVYLFETGFRLSGELSFKYGERVFGINYIDLLIHTAFTDEIPQYEFFQKITDDKLLVVNYFGKAGEIATVRINDERESLHASGIEFINYHTNSKMDQSNGIPKKCGMIFLYGNTAEIMSKYSHYKESFQIIGSANKDVNYYRPTLDEIVKFVG